MTEKQIIEVADLDEVIFLINHGVPMFMELAANCMHIDDDAHPWGGNSFSCQVKQSGILMSSVKLEQLQV